MAAAAVAATTTERGCAAETATTGATDTQRDECSFAYHSYRSTCSIASRSPVTNVMQIRDPSISDMRIFSESFPLHRIKRSCVSITRDTRFMRDTSCNPCCLLSANFKNDYANCLPHPYFLAALLI